VADLIVDRNLLRICAIDVWLVDNPTKCALRWPSFHHGSKHLKCQISFLYRLGTDRSTAVNFHVEAGDELGLITP